MAHTQVSDQPTVSVVLPFGKERFGLPEQLEALARSPLLALNAEVVVSCNNASEIEWVKSVIAEVPDSRRFRVVDSSVVVGPAAARNTGWRAANGSRILFCDSDDLIDENWIAVATAALAQADVVVGALEYGVLNDPQQVPSNGYLSSGPGNKFRHLPAGSSSNLAVRKTALESLNGFDERLLSGEDIDFCWRAQYAGLTVRFEPEMIVHYRMRSAPAAQWRQSYRNAKNDALLLSLHKGFGASYPASDWLHELAALAWAAAHSPFGRKWREKTIKRAAGLLGHLVGRWNSAFNGMGESGCEGSQSSAARILDREHPGPHS